MRSRSQRMAASTPHPDARPRVAAAEDRRANGTPPYSCHRPVGQLTTLARQWTLLGPLRLSVSAWASSQRGVKSMSEMAECSQTPDERDLGVRALRALATAQ